MEDQQKPTKKIALNYGLLLGFVSILQSLILYAMGKTYDNDWYTTAIGILIMAIIIFLGIKKYKESNNGFLSLGQGLKTGVGIALIAAVVSIIYTIIFVKFIEPDFINHIVEVQRQKMLENPNMTDEMIDKIGQGTRDYFYVFTIGMIFIFNIFIGFVVSLVTSLILKKSEEDQY
jgi:multisubunit Na+/H+ antiporter MnhF subunit